MKTAALLFLVLYASIFPLVASARDSGHAVPQRLHFRDGVAHARGYLRQIDSRAEFVFYGHKGQHVFASGGGVVMLRFPNGEEEGAPGASGDCVIPESGDCLITVTHHRMAEFTPGPFTLRVDLRDVPAQGGSALIVPGKSLGEISLGMTLPEVEKLLGKPTGRHAADGKIWEWWDGPNYAVDALYQVMILAESTSGNRTKSVVSIRADSPFFHTTEGISTWSKLGDIWKAFPDLHYDNAHPSKDKAIETYTDAAQGIALEGNRLRPEAGLGNLAISIFQPGSGQPLEPLRATEPDRVRK